MRTRERPASPVSHQPIPVIGLEHGRAVARRRARARRRSNSAVGFAVFGLIAASAVGAGYVTWDYFQGEQDAPVVESDRMTVDEVIEELERRPAWNGPGSPAFGIGDGP